MYAREVDVTRLRKRALLGNGQPQQYPDGVFYRVGPQAINPRERSSSTDTESIIEIQRSGDQEIGVFDIL
jgi:hypothetical protein